jgi:hypothetical protein
VIVIGIDPGLTGAACAIDTERNRCAGIVDLPTVDLEGGGLVRRRIDGRALTHQLRALIPAGARVRVVLEQVGAMGGQDNAVQTQVSLGRTLGAIECALDILGLKPVMVSPLKWKVMYGIKRHRGEKESAFKARHVDKALALYPEAPITLAKHHNRAEALLMAHWGRSTLP